MSEAKPGGVETTIDDLETRVNDLLDNSELTRQVPNDISLIQLEEPGGRRRISLYRDAGVKLVELRWSELQTVVFIDEFVSEWRVKSFVWRNGMVEFREGLESRDENDVVMLDPSEELDAEASATHEDIRIFMMHGQIDLADELLRTLHQRHLEVFVLRDWTHDDLQEAATVLTDSFR